MAEGVFDRRGQFSKRLLVAFRDEKGVVSKSPFSLLFGEQSSLDLSFEDTPHAAVLRERHCAAETRAALVRWFASKFTQQFCAVVGVGGTAPA